MTDYELASERLSSDGQLQIEVMRDNGEMEYQFVKTHCLISKRLIVVITEAGAWIEYSFSEDGSSRLFIKMSPGYSGALRPKFWPCTLPQSSS